MYKNLKKSLKNLQVKFRRDQIVYNITVEQKDNQWILKKIKWDKEWNTLTLIK